MQLRTFARRAIGVTAAGLLSIGTVATAAPANADEIAPTDSTGEVGYLAQAYGSYIYTLDRKISSGPTAYTGVACTTAAGRQSTNNTAEVNVPGIAQVGATQTAVETIEDNISKSAKASSTTASADVLSGLIKVGAITSETTATKTGGEFSAEHVSKIAKLSILGKEIDVEAGPNSKIELKLPLLGTVGYIELNKQSEGMVGDEYRAATSAVHVAILEDVKISKHALVADNKTAYLTPGKDLALSAGTHVWLGTSRAHLQPPQDSYLNGRAFATRVTLLDGTIHSGRTADTGVPCRGGSSHNSVASVKLPHLIDLGAAESTGEGVVNEEYTSSTLRTEIAGSKLLGDLIEVEAITAVASASQEAGGPVELSAEGTKLLGLKINGKPVADAEIGPNTVIDLDIAKITLNKQVKTKRSISVTAIEIELLDDIAGLPTGSLIEVGHARAGLSQ